MSILKTLTKPLTQQVDLGLLFFRITVGSLMLTHGFGKFQNLMAGKTGFLDPLGLGPVTSLVLVVFAEFFCALLLVVGLFTRAALLPMIITMLVAFLIFHGADPLASKELALIYLIGFVALFFTGPGRYSLDQILHQKLK